MFPPLLVDFSPVHLCYFLNIVWINFDLTCKMDSKAPVFFVFVLH